jgi:hypothetical protein
MSEGSLARRGGCTIRMKGFRRKAGRGTAGIAESVIDALKKGTSASGRNTLTIKLVESVGTNSKRARCFCTSGGYCISGHEHASAPKRTYSNMCAHARRSS